MLCDGCGSQDATRLSIRGSDCSCNLCGQMSRMDNPDVYFKGRYLDPHLVDCNKPEQRHGVWVESRAHKAELMRKLGVKECGDPVRGSRNEDKTAQRIEREKGFGR